MDQHPIPQNVTGFQFKLIGTMTVKQFGYVAVGVIAAFITYYLPIPGVVGALLKILLIPFLGASGVITAFVPIDGRPIDVMAGNFLKALFSPNQYVYRKNPKRFSFSTIQLAKAAPAAQHVQPVPQTQQAQADQKEKALQRLLTNSSMHKIANPQDMKEAAFLKAVATPSLTMTASPLPKPVQVANPLPKLPDPLPKKPPAPVPNTEVIAQQEAALEKQLATAKEKEATSHDAQQVAMFHQKTTELEKQLNDVRTQKQLLEQEISKLKSQLAAQQTHITASSPQPAPAVKLPVQSAAHVRSVPKEMNKKMGLLVSDTPNVVAGVVKDPRGNVLQNILVEIKDKAENPVRAFKTNSLGNFASATPLPPGTYTITLEDPKKQHMFDEIQITATNQVMLPIEIISYDKREQLRKELFN